MRECEAEEGGEEEIWKERECEAGKGEGGEEEGEVEEIWRERQ